MQLFKNITLLNIILLAIIIVSLKFIVLPLLEYKPDFTIDPQTIREDNDNRSKEDNKKNNNKLLIEPGELSSYSIIADQNLFHPERKIVIVEEKKIEEALPAEEVAEIEFILYGTLMAGNVRVAFMESKVNLPLKNQRTIRTSREAREAQVKEKENEPEKPKKRFYEGDILEGYTLKKINSEDVVLVKEKEEVTVKVYDPANPKKRQSVSSRALDMKKQQINIRTPATPATPAAIAPTAVPRSVEQDREQRENMQEKVDRYRRSRTFQRR